MTVVTCVHAEFHAGGDKRGTESAGDKSQTCGREQGDCMWIPTSLPPFLFLCWVVSMSMLAVDAMMALDGEADAANLYICRA